MKKQRVFFCLIVFISAIIGFFTILYTTTIGIGITPDSVEYVSVAKSIIRNGALFNYLGEPLVHFPPIYSIILSGIGLLFRDILQAAKYLQAILFVFNIIVISLILYRITEGSLPVVLSGNLIILPAYTMLYVHSYAWTEPIFILLSLLSLWLLSEYLYKPKPYFIIGASLFICLTILTRYIGLALVPTALISIWIMGNNINKRKKIISSFIILSSLIGFGLWTTRNVLIADSAINRQLVFYPINMQTISDGFFTLCSWLYIFNLDNPIHIIKSWD